LKHGVSRLLRLAIKLFLDKLAAARQWRRPRFYFFCNPSFVSAPALIFFPYYPNILYCGITGILNIKLESSPDTAVSISSLSKNIAQIASAAILPTSNYNEVLTQTFAEIISLRTNRHITNIITNDNLHKKLQKIAEQLEKVLIKTKNYRSQEAGNIGSNDWERLNGKIIIMEDALWALKKDILANLPTILNLAGRNASLTAIEKFAQINLVLNSIDRLEVRGRDSAGIEISFTFSQSNWEKVLAEITQQGLENELQNRALPADAKNGTIQIFPSKDNQQTSIAFIYKTFSIVGELGKNVRELREYITKDALLHIFANWKTQNEVVLSHTRWASVGAISEENCHPLNNYTLSERRFSPMSVVLNGDIDNHSSLRNQIEKGKTLIAPSISTDTKIIPLLIDTLIGEGNSIEVAFRLALNAFAGSHAIVMTNMAAPGKVFLAQRGSGQNLYVGIIPQGYIFSSELYGLIEATPNFIRLDGEARSRSGVSGQIFILDQEGKGGERGIKACFYDGEPILLTNNASKQAEITTRDIDRGEHPHYFFKEIMESPRSVTNTLLGKYRFEGNAASPRLVFQLGEEILPARVIQGLKQRTFTDIFVIGHGTAGVAAAAITDAFSRYFQNSSIRVSDKIASELSGFHIDRDFSRSIVIPITQSGTTTDTNRAVTMAKERGAVIISIVNRRQSDITAKSDGVFYTSNGRDIEMSVASTKAFYSQITAGNILGLCLASIAGEITSEEARAEIKALESIAPAMSKLLSQHRLLQDAARLAVKGTTHWAVVGSGPNKIAADEIRIKLSELCYKTISTDIIENKKHIDLSAEPLIIVCAAGMPPSVLEDIVKDVAIFKAHRSQVVVFADEGERRFDGIADVIVPIVDAAYPASIILNTIAGHLWGYYAACYIDEEAQHFKRFRSKLNTLLSEHELANKSVYEQINDGNTKVLVNTFARETQKKIAAGAFRAADTKALINLVILLKYASGKLPIDDFWEEFGTLEEVSPLLSLDATLKTIIDSLARPVDAIRHQAKTVTVGTSRKELEPTGVVFDLVSSLGFSHKSIVSRNMLAILRVQPVIAEILGYTLYNIENLDRNSQHQDSTTITIARRAGISLQIPSRIENTKELMGTKKTIIRKKDIYIGQGKADGKPILLFPIRELNDSTKEFLLLIHVRFDDNLDWEIKKRALGTRYNDIRNLCDEYNIIWSDEYLQGYPLAYLLGEQAGVIVKEIQERLV